ncbi:hypothetical protein RYX45_14465 [Alkalihalophilus pseudofirmus]|uniref:Uncharacterized protein n=1 Tax=Alkalihalophilus pseudofirmus TaxID=79885 RepID=A0AAJ2NPV1_ALKPS|nr:hypothetical protein [Alkalihalophilus pseudofirmus]MDV2886390.1 hypothetical protein [Alkalihalophilus pseudofirmus]
MDRSRKGIVMTLSVLIISLGVIGTVKFFDSEPAAEQSLASSTHEVDFTFNALDIVPHIEPQIATIAHSQDKDYILWYINHYDQFLHASTEWFNKLDIENNPYSEQEKFVEDLEKARVEYAKLSQEITIDKVNEQPNDQYLVISYDAYYDAAASVAAAIDIASSSYHRGYISEHEKTQLQELYNETKSQLDYSSYSIVKYFELLAAHNELDQVREKHSEEVSDTPETKETTELPSTPIFYEDNGTIYIYGVTLGQKVEDAVAVNGEPMNYTLDEAFFEEWWNTMTFPSTIMMVRSPQFRCKSLMTVYS